MCFFFTVLIDNFSLLLTCHGHAINSPKNPTVSRPKKGKAICIFSSFSLFHSITLKNLLSLLRFTLAKSFFPWNMSKHSNCDCADVSHQKKALVKKSLNLPVILRGTLAVVFVLSFAKSTIPEKLAPLLGFSRWLSYVPTLAYLIAIVVVALCSRFVLVGTCCLPSLQLRNAELQRVLDESDKDMESRLYGRRLEMAKLLSTAITFQTISYDLEDTKNKTDYTQFTKMHHFLEKSYPLFYKNLEKTVINDYSLIFKWQGSDKNQKPYLLTAHQDVVPCPELHKWSVRISWTFVESEALSLTCFNLLFASFS